MEWDGMASGVEKGLEPAPAGGQGVAVGSVLALSGHFSYLAGFRCSAKATALCPDTAEVLVGGPDLRA